MHLFDVSSLATTGSRRAHLSFVALSFLSSRYKLPSAWLPAQQVDICGAHALLDSPSCS